tara:strand:+ start:520 stop:1356 length:837 start_codon:yes stop_codon:yes gene_type:complete
MLFKSYSKINLTLKVGPKNKNGLHEIQSYFCLIDLVDIIKLKKIKTQKDKITFSGPFAKFVKKSNNSILDILRLLRSLKLISNFYSVSIKKNIPVFAGLGGGTGNAAFIIKHLIKKKINKTLLNRVETEIGSDLKLFFYKQGFLKNLKSITYLKKKQKMFFVLIQPNIKCSTKEIYARAKNYTKIRPVKEYAINSKFSFINYLSKSNNELQSIVEKKYPVIKKLLMNIKNEKGCYFSRMTGSGSVCYGLFNNQVKAKKALNNLKIRYPKFWLSIAKTV